MAIPIALIIEAAGSFANLAFDMVRKWKAGEITDEEATAEWDKMRNELLEANARWEAAGDPPDTVGGG